jgi:apolipoprotein N-acyltransferase
VITGTIDVRASADSEARPTRLATAKKNYELYNAAVLLSPIQTGSGHRQTVSSEPYHKRKLMPFAERVPYSDRFPALSKLAVDLNWDEEFQSGDRPRVFSFLARQGNQVLVATPICYEHFYPALFAELVRNGAQVITLLSNDAWFSKSHGEYQIAAFTTLRAIETRRSIVRCTNTGLTCCIDPFGRIYSAIPWWREDTLLADVALSNQMSLYVRYPDRFPKICAWSAALVLLAVVLKWLNPLVYQ